MDEPRRAETDGEAWEVRTLALETAVRRAGQVVRGKE